MPLEKLVYMANQIGKFFAAQGEEAAIVAVADHLNKFWDPRMRKQILSHASNGGGGLDPIVAAALATLNVQSRA